MKTIKLQLNVELLFEFISIVLVFYGPCKNIGFTYDLLFAKEV